MPFLLALRTAFTFWMLADAYKRRVGHHWYFIITIPGGELAYFLIVKRHDKEITDLGKRLIPTRPKLSQLRYNAETSPSIHNKILLAQGLHDEKLFEEAIQQFNSVLIIDSKCKEALHGLGLCLLKTKQALAAVEPLKQLVTLQMNYDNYSPCADLAHAYRETGNHEAAIEVLQQVLRQSNRLTHRLELARYYHEQKRNSEAKTLLETGLIDYENSPRHIKKSERAAAREAKLLLRTLPKN